jgi:ZIP family zinc transporter
MICAVSFSQTVALGAIAGFTIFLGLPVGRLPRLGPAARVGLSMLSAGILVFIFVDVGSHSMEIIEGRLTTFHQGDASFWPVVWLFLLLTVGFLAGVGGIHTAQRRMAGGRAGLPPAAGGESAAVLSPPELHEQSRAIGELERRALHTGMTIAAAIGLHNFAEGLAIGVSAQAGEIGLATVLIVGFALHNATEGFGIVGPLGGVRPSWRWLATAGLVAGGPTFLGSIIGYQVTSDAIELLFYAVAGGAILYVVGEIWAGVRRQGHAELGLYLLGAGFLLGVATDLVVAYGGS